MTINIDDIKPPVTYNAYDGHFDSTGLRLSKYMEPSGDRHLIEPYELVNKLQVKINQLDDQNRTLKREIKLCASMFRDFEYSSGNGSYGREAARLDEIANS